MIVKPLPVPGLCFCGMGTVIPDKDTCESPDCVAQQSGDSSFLFTAAKRPLEIRWCGILSISVQIFVHIYFGKLGYVKIF